MKKLILGLLILAAAASGAYYLWAKKKSAEAVVPAVETQVTEVKRGPLRQTAQCTGRVVSNLDVEIKCKASGLVVKLPFDISDQVKKGDLLAEIDPVDQERNVQQAEAAIAASRAKHEQAVANLAVSEANLAAEKLRAAAALESAQARNKDAAAKAKREKELLDSRQTSIEDAETAETTAIEAAQNLRNAEAQIDAVKALELQLEMRRQEINLAKAQVDSDQIALSLANQRLSETKVSAPIDGVVAARTVQVGQIIASGINNVGGGTTILTLSDLSQIFILASVDESDIGNIALDQPVEITADAFPGKQFSGKVVRIAARGVNVSNVVTFEVRIEVLSDNKALLKPEMTTNVTIVTAERKDALLVPAGAIIRKNGKAFVKVKTPGGGEEERGPIETGIYAGTDIEILGGLQENEQVVVRDLEEASRWRMQSQSQRPRPGPMMMPGMRRGR